MRRRNGKYLQKDEKFFLQQSYRDSWEDWKFFDWGKYILITAGEDTYATHGSDVRK